MGEVLEVVWYKLGLYLGSSNGVITENKYFWWIQKENHWAVGIFRGHYFLCQKEIGRFSPLFWKKIKIYRATFRKNEEWCHYLEWKNKRTTRFHLDHVR